MGWLAWASWRRPARDGSRASAASRPRSGKGECPPSSSAMHDDTDGVTDGVTHDVTHGVTDGVTDGVTHDVIGDAIARRTLPRGPWSTGSRRLAPALAPLTRRSHNVTPPVHTAVMEMLMRTTLTFDSTVLAAFKQQAAETHKTISGVIETALREQLPRQRDVAATKPRPQVCRRSHQQRGAGSPPAVRGGVQGGRRAWQSRDGRLPGRLGHRDRGRAGEHGQGLWPLPGARLAAALRACGQRLPQPAASSAAVS